MIQRRKYEQKMELIYQSHTKVVVTRDGRRNKSWNIRIMRMMTSQPMQG
ncbi:unnamed protein product [Onchocerca flexuosa]|uniref:Transposase n=1 Tax=Onchocerca flexuosa TaxID=387005 RepID=A0A183I7A4_9BILA|nr:unnamed protein product [Onchocerca flexuosa]